MPVVRIDLDEDRGAEQRRAISDAVHRAFVAAIGLPQATAFTS
jgi:hypothetical protein